SMRALSRSLSQTCSAAASLTEETTATITTTRNNARQSISFSPILEHCQEWLNSFHERSSVEYRLPLPTEIDSIVSDYQFPAGLRLFASGCEESEDLYESENWPVQENCFRDVAHDTPIKISNDVDLQE